MTASPGGRPRALLVVEDQFLTLHVGVRRVIAHYWSRLEAAGHTVDVAVARKGTLTAATAGERERARAVVLAREEGLSPATWTSWGPDFPRRPPAETVSPARRALQWGGGRVDPADYDVSILTNPWLCAEDVPRGRYTHGVVYDLVPNLVSAGALDLVEFFDVTRFAHEHHLGFRFYEENVQTVACISASTRNDLLRFYLRGEPERAVVDIPFDSNHRDRTVSAGSTDGRSADARVLLVNPLDHRKNLKGIREVLLSLAERRSLSLSVVGRERIPWATAGSFFEDLTDAGISLQWFRGASDDRLDALYEESDVLLFPSIYEGLGLPILEAQAHGLPAVSSSTSSCGEINLNPHLAVDPTDVDALTAAVEHCLDGGDGTLRGVELRTALDEFVLRNGRGLPWGATDGPRKDAVVAGVGTAAG